MTFKYLATLLILLSIPMTGLQEDADSDEDSADWAPTVAYLNLVYDKTGSLTVDMTLPAQPQSWDNVALALSQMLQCSVGNFRHPAVSSAALKYFDNLPAGQRQQRIQQFEQQYALQLNGTCAESLHRTGLMLDGSLDTARLFVELQTAGVKSL